MDPIRCVCRLVVVVTRLLLVQVVCRRYIVATTTEGHHLLGYYGIVVVAVMMRVILMQHGQFGAWGESMMFVGLGTKRISITLRIVIRMRLQVYSVRG